jgi:enolase
MSFKIKKVLAREILDSRGNPTIECDVVLPKGIIGRAAVPSGASTGKHEALELRDGGKRFHGMGTTTAIRHITDNISKKIIGIDCRKQEDIDNKMLLLDGTKDKSLLGANAILAVSLATARAAASKSNMPLYKYLSKNKRKHIMPIPFSNVINGGVHAGNSLRFQEFMIVPTEFDSFRKAVTAVSEVYHELKALLEKRFGKESTNVGDEGGFAPSISMPMEALGLLESAVAATGYKNKIKFAIDAAASEFYDKKEKTYEVEEGKKLSAPDLVDYYLKLTKDFPIISIEDPFYEESFAEFSELNKKLIPREIQVVGDDLLVTDTERITKAITRNSCSCLLLKLNQIGTLTESLSAAKLAIEHDWNVMVSHRSGETEDTFISDFVVALGTGQIKLGAPARGERTAKYNQLLRIEEELGKEAQYGKF